MRFKETRYSSLRLAWMWQRMKAHEIKMKKLKPYSIWNVALVIAIPIDTIVLAIRQKEDLQVRHDVIVAHVERYWDWVEEQKCPN